MLRADNGRESRGVPGGNETVSSRAVLILLAGMSAAWFAGGSTGFLGHPLQRALTLAALAVALLMGLPRRGRTLRAWAVLAGGGVFGALLIASPMASVRVFGVAVVLGAIAEVRRGLTGRVALLGAIGVFALGVFRFACESVPTVWLVADGLGWMLGRFAGWLVGEHLEVGASFGGIDFLVLSSVIYVGWLVGTCPPRWNRAMIAGVAILASQIAYLSLLACSEKLLAELPAVVVPVDSDASHVGIWTWSNGLRTLVPWNLPLLLLVLQDAIVAVMLRSSRWLPVIEADSEGLEQAGRIAAKETMSGGALVWDMAVRFGPALLAVTAAVAGCWELGARDLGGKTIVAYDKGRVDWMKPAYDSPVEGFGGLLPLLVESFGGKFLRSEELSASDLAKADVLLLVHPDRPWPQDVLERVWDYVRRGGSLLVAADPAVRLGDSASHFQEVLSPLAMRVRFDTAIPRAVDWEQSCFALSHPATASLDIRRNCFGLERGASIETFWPARPVLVGRWGWSDPGNDAATGRRVECDSGEMLGDLVLAAEQRWGAGRVFVLGGTAPLRNERLAGSYPFVGQLLTYLAHRGSSPQSCWRQAATLAALLVMLGLVAARPAAWQVLLTASVMGAVLLGCEAGMEGRGPMLPDGRPKRSGQVNRLAYVDASHLEAYSSELSADHGIRDLLQTFMRQGYLPLLASEVSPERLKRAGLLVSIGPAREFSPAERETIKSFVEEGGTFIGMIGAEESRASAALLADFGLKVPRSPLRPGEEGREPAPKGAQSAQLDGPHRQFRFYAAWPVESTDGSAEKLVSGDEDGNWGFVYRRRVGRGSFVVIGDTHFASNENFRPQGRSEPARILFWRWLLSRVVSGEAEWRPAADSSSELPGDDGDGIAVEE